MKIVIDTNSLLSLVRYYLPFDKNATLLNFFKNKIEEGEIIIIDKVYEQCSYIAKGLVFDKLDFLLNKTFLKSAKLPHKTEGWCRKLTDMIIKSLENQDYIFSYQSFHATTKQKIFLPLLLLSF